jgi:hypothetical protein
MCSCNYALKLIIMEDSSKKVFKPKFEIVQESNGLFNTFVSIRAALLQGTEISGTTLEDHQMLVMSCNPSRHCL